MFFLSSLGNDACVHLYFSRSAELDIGRQHVSRQFKEQVLLKPVSNDGNQCIMPFVRSFHESMYGKIDLDCSLKYP